MKQPGKWLWFLAGCVAISTYYVVWPFQGADTTGWWNLVGVALWGHLGWVVNTMEEGAYNQGMRIRKER